MHVHLVFVTKYRRESVHQGNPRRPAYSIFTKRLRRLRGGTGGVRRRGRSRPPAGEYPPKVAVSALVNSLKGVSSRMIRKQELPEHPQKTVGRAHVVAVLLRSEVAAVRRFRDHPPVHRTAADATLTAQKDAYGVRAILPRPEGRGLPRTLAMVLFPTV
jgi:hypothetical protein